LSSSSRKHDNSTEAFGNLQTLKVLKRPLLWIHSYNIYIYFSSSVSFNCRMAIFPKYTVKKVIDFPIPSRDVTTLAGNNLIIPGRACFVSSQLIFFLLCSRSNWCASCTVNVCLFPRIKFENPYWTYITAPQKEEFDFKVYVFKLVFFTFHSWEYISWKFLALNFIWLHDSKRN